MKNKTEKSNKSINTEVISESRNPPPPTAYSKPAPTPTPPPKDKE
ncbi:MULTISPECIES: hypothetical protein [Pectobacterium]|nr:MULTISPECIES: hypothetical protein [Pectobacterium]